MYTPQLLPKVEPLPGSVHVKWVRCGTAGCRCAQGELHGPFYRRFWRENGRTKSQYVRLADAPDVIAACERHAQIHLSRRAFRQMVRDLERASDQVIAVLDAHYKGGKWNEPR